MRLVTAPAEPEEPAPEVRGDDPDPTDDELSPTNVGLTVGNLPSALGGVAFVAPDAGFDSAITLMLLNDFSQLAVFSNPHKLRGAVTWESIARARHANSAAHFTSGIVEEAPVVRYDKELIDVLPMLQQLGFVFVKNEKNAVAGIVTTADVVSAYGQMAGPFFEIGELDQTLRRIIARNLEVDEVSSLCGKTFRSFDEMSMGDYQRVLSNNDVWSRLGWPLDRVMITRHLDATRRIRNAVMHFNPDPLPADAMAKLRKLSALLKQYSD